MGVEGYTLCTKRIINFATKIDLFQEFNLPDRKNLLLFNTEMLVNIQSARILRPEHNLIDQLSIVFGKNPVVIDSSKSSALVIKKRLEYRQLYSSPWASEQKEEERFFFLMNNIFELQMDQITTIIVSLMALFSQSNVQLIEKEKAEKQQNFFTLLLHRYLCHSIGKHGASKLLPRYIQMLSG